MVESFGAELETKSVGDQGKSEVTRWNRGKLVGVISQRDLSGVLAGALNEPDVLSQLIEASELVSRRRLKRIEHGVWD